MDDKFHRNRKVVPLAQSGLGLQALGVWVFWWSWCLDDPELTGTVPKRIVPRAHLKAAAELVAAGLWDEADDGYQFHDFTEYNPTREKLDAKRASDRARQRDRRQRESRRDTVRELDGDTEAETAATPPRVASPARPGPARPSPNSSAADEIPETLLPVTSDEVCKEWHRAAMQPGGNPSVLHGQSQWRTDYETVVAALGIVPEENRRIALRAVCEWFWLAPDGPIQTARIDRMVATPFYLAKNISRDLKAANAWFASREAAQ